MREELPSASRLLLGSRLTLVGGKGGVGKTTTAAAVAVGLADEGVEVVVISIDPAHSLGDAFGVALGPDPAPVPGFPRLSAMEVDPDVERTRFLDSHRGALLSLLERGTYLDREDATGLVDLTIPGIDELAALFRLQALLSPNDRCVVVDTAPTGHTLSLLDLPEIARGWLGALQAMEDKRRAVSTALVGAYDPDDASRLLSEVDEELTVLTELLTDPGRTRFLLVTDREPVVLAETFRFRKELARRGIGIAGVVVNRSAAGDIPVFREGRAAPPEEPSAPGGGETLASGEVRTLFVPRLDPEPVGSQGLREFAQFLFGRGVPTLPPEATLSGELTVGASFTPPSDRALYLVGGKGGVGKSTVAAALGVTLAAEGRRVLLLSVDPAGSLAEVLDQEVGAGARPVEGAPGLWARQLDSGAQWEEFRSRYRMETERIFGTLLSGGLSASSDRDVVARLVDLAPAGMDELAALMEVVDVTEDRPYDALILDTAPTGHFLRLLELPEVALEWTHQVMGLLLKYREVVRPGELAGRLLRLAQSLHRFVARLRDSESTWALSVALPEALSVPESRRLLRRLDELGVQPGALLINRLLRDGRVHPPAAHMAGLLAEAAGGLPLAGAPDELAGPRGPESLAAFARGWRLLNPRRGD